MVNFVAAGAVQPGVFTPLFGGQPVRIWTPGVPLLSPRRVAAGGGDEGRGRGGEESNARAPPPPPMTLPGCIPLDRRNPMEAWSTDSINSGLTSPMARNVNAIMAAVNGTKSKRRVTFLDQSGSVGRTSKNGAVAHKNIQDRKIERRPARNPYRKSETQTRRKVFPARANKSATTKPAATGNQSSWNFPTRVEEFQKPEVEDIFRDFWKSIEDHQMESYFRDFWKCVKAQDDKMESYFGQFWKEINTHQDSDVDINDFWRRIEGRIRKACPKENLAADFWKMIETNQQRQILDEAVMAGHFLRMIESTQRCQHESRPWEAPSRDLWKLISQEEKLSIEDNTPPEALVGEFFGKLKAEDERQKNEVDDKERVSGQFWRMVEKNMDDGKEIKFVADSSGNVFRTHKGYQIQAERRESMAEAKMVNDFFEMVDNEQRDVDARVEILVGIFWNMIHKPKNDELEIKFVADSSGTVFRNHKGYQVKASQQKTTTNAQWVSQFFRMVEKEGLNDVEIFAGNFWKMINNSKVQTERKPREAVAGDFWKMVEFTENLKRKRETMRRLSASKREEEAALSASCAAPPFVPAATPRKNDALDKKEGARKTALLFACSTLEEQAYYVLAPDYQNPQGQVGRKRTASSSSSSLYSVKEEEELKPEAAATAAAQEANPRHLFRVTPHYGRSDSNTSLGSNNSQQLGAARASAAAKSGVVWVALRQKKKNVKPQQCHRQNMVAQERRGIVTRRNRIPSVSAIGSNNDRKCGRKSW